jgi:AcrR family transcriptional regulator
MARKPGVERREEIIDVTAQVLLEKGLAAATTRDVTAQLGVGVGLLNHYFSWSELRATAFELIVQHDLEASLPKERTVAPKSLLEELIKNTFARQADSIWRLWVDCWELSAKDELLAKAARTQLRAWRERLAWLIEQGNSGNAWQCEDPQGAAWRILALLDGLAGYVLSSAPELTRAQATAHLRIAVTHELNLPMKEFLRA